MKEYGKALGVGMLVMFVLSWMDLFVAWLVACLTAYGMLIVKYKWLRKQ